MIRFDIDIRHDTGVPGWACWIVVELTETCQDEMGRFVVVSWFVVNKATGEWRWPDGSSEKVKRWQYDRQCGPPISYATRRSAAFVAKKLNARGPEISPAFNERLTLDSEGMIYRELGRICWLGHTAESRGWQARRRERDHSEALKANARCAVAICDRCGKRATKSESGVCDRFDLHRELWRTSHDPPQLCVNCWNNLKPISACFYECEDIRYLINKNKEMTRYVSRKSPENHKYRKPAPISRQSLRGSGVRL